MAFDGGLLKSEFSVFDFGCGRGDDIAELQSLGLDARGWDPAHRPHEALVDSNVVYVGYVLNVIENELERRRVLDHSWGLATSVLIVAVRLENDRDESHAVRHRDGWLTSAGTFQKFFQHDEIADFCEAVLGERPVAIGLGVFAVFRDHALRQEFEIASLRKTIRVEWSADGAEMINARNQIYARVAEFTQTHGRPPRSTDLLVGVEDGGSIRSAVRLLQSVESDEWWESAAFNGRRGLLLHLARESFRGREKWNSVPRSIQSDVRALYGSYESACSEADRLLMACGDSSSRSVASRAARVGKRTGNALYVHESAIADLPVLLQMYEACALQLTGERAGNIIKLHIQSSAVSYLDYPDFDEVGHPALRESTLVDLAERRVRRQSYEARPSRPILHRKELFVNSDYPSWHEFRRLTEEEVSAGLFDDPSSIGTEQQWNDRLAESRLRIEGHSLLAEQIGQEQIRHEL